jgi:hypothetical protein
MKTAVEWLQDTWLNYPDLCSYDKIQEWFEQAKEMEKNQIIKSVDYCLESIKISDDKTMFTATTAEQYYNQTFKKEKQSYQDKMRDKIAKAKSRII